MNSTRIYPDFTNSLVNVPHTVLEHFGLPHDKPSIDFALQQVTGCSKLVLFLSDGLGYNFWNQHARHSQFFKTILENGQSQKITSVFPSSTAPSLTTVQSGLTPREHGLLEWDVYFQEVEGILATLPYRREGNTGPTAQSKLPEHPKILYADKTVYEHLDIGDVASFCFLPKQYASSVYSSAITRGATVCPYTTTDDLMTRLTKLLEETDDKAYFYVYWDGIDIAEHRFGPDSKQAKTAFTILSDMLCAGLVSKLSPLAAQSTGLLVTADHGQVMVNPKNRIYLNNYPQITDCFKKDSHGQAILPTGNTRDVFLTIDERQVDTVIASLKAILQNRADVLKIESSFIKKLFGDEKPHAEFFNRLGNVLILPKQSYTVWYQYEIGAKGESFGEHGGLSPDEMYIPLIAARISSLR